ncbi:MAG: N-acetylmuramoyl-L-alanine amidase [Flavobacteriaceae bacterium]
MINKINLKIRLLLLFSLVFVANTAFSQTDEKFKVVLDAGHGGEDPGAVKNGVKEKDVVLPVALKVGKLLEKYKDIEVVYTRKTDVFIPVKERSVIANKAKANIFVSIHCNSNDSSRPYGTETFVMGVSKDKSNMEVAKRENSVIFLEEDYQEKYQKYDPNNPESVIGMVLMQGIYKDQSIHLASNIQKNFTTDLKRHNRGVKQDIFYVLHGCSMPSVLTELGFLSNAEEAKYLKSEKGQNQLAQSIAQAIVNYKNEYYAFSEPFEIVIEPEQAQPEKQTEKQPEKVNHDSPVYKIQIAASGTNLETKPQNFNGLDTITKTKDGSLYRYYYGETNSHETAQKLLKEAKDKGYTTAFIVTFKDGERVK